MKKFLKNAFSLALVCMFLFNITASASNSILPQSSSYIMGTSADIIAESNGAPNYFLFNKQLWENE